MDNYGYEEAAPTTALDESNAASTMSSKSKRSGIFRRGSLFGGSTNSAAKSSRRARRSSLSYVDTMSRQATSGEHVAPIKKQHSKRRGSISASLRSNFSRGRSNAADESYDDRPEESSGSRGESLTVADSALPPAKGAGRKSGGRNRRSSLFHVGGHMGSSSRDATDGITIEKVHSKDERVSGNAKKSNKFNPFRRSATTAEAGVSKKKKNTKKKKTSSSEILREFEEMEDFVKALQKDPKSLKLLQERLQNEKKGNYCSAA